MTEPLRNAIQRGVATPTDPEFAKREQEYLDAKKKAEDGLRATRKMLEKEMGIAR